MAFINDQEAMLSSVANSAEAFLQTQFDLFTLQAILALYNLAKSNGLTNRAAYLYPAILWYMGFLSYVASIQNQVTAATMDVELGAIQWDSNYAAFLASNPTPTVTIAGALAING